MTPDPISAAAKPNSKLAPLAILIGEWNATGSHPFFPGDILHGHASFKWIEGGAFMMMHASINHKDFPAGIAIFGSDDNNEIYSMIYFDERGVSRQYMATLKDNMWKWWRDDAEFSQRFNCRITDNGDTIVAKGEMRKKGGEWEKDLQLTYTRIKS